MNSTGRGDDQKKLTAFLRPVAKQLRAEADRLRKSVAVIETKVLTGQLVERFDADVICLGSHGRSGVSAVLMGSVAQALIAQSRRPVLVVRPPIA